MPPRFLLNPIITREVHELKFQSELQFLTPVYNIAAAVSGVKATAALSVSWLIRGKLLGS
ncbi:hypothetical protein J6590_001598, partial [Homalodisca vitripennis]